MVKLTKHKKSKQIKIHLVSFENKPPEVYQDVSSGQLLIGADAQERHIESGGHPADVHEIGALSLQGSELAVVTPVDIGIDWNKAPVPEVVDNARWVFDIVKRARSGGDLRRKDVNHDIVIALNRMGLGPSYTRIYRDDDIGGMENYYDLLGLENFHRVGRDFPTEFLIEHLRIIGIQLRRRPLEKDLAKRWKQDPENNPHPEVYAKAFGSFGEASEEAGYVVPKAKHWDEARYLDWGLKFRIVNDGLPSDYKILRQLSKRGFSPSESGCIQNFGNLATYNQLADDAYLEHLANRDNLLGDLKRDLDAHEGLFKLFTRAKTVDNLLEAYVKFRICQEVFADIPIDNQYALADRSLDEIKDMAEHLANNSDVESLINDRGYTYFVRRPKLTHQQLKIKGQTVARPQPASQILRSKPEWAKKLAHAKKEAEALSFDQLKSRLQEEIRSGEVPLRLLRGATTPQAIVSRFSRFQIVRTLLPHTSVEVQVQISKPERTRNDLVETIIKHHPTLDPTKVNVFLKKSPYSPYILARNAA